MSGAVGTLEVEIFGEGPPLVFIHGAGGSPRGNYPFLDDFAARHTVIAPYLPGCGRSAIGSHPLTARGIADQVAHYVAEHDVSRYSVVGYSMGTTIAVELAAAHPQRVRSMALTAGFLLAGSTMRNFVELWTHLQDGPPEPLGRALLAAVFKPETIDAFSADELQVRSLEIASELAPGTRAHLDLIRRVDARDALRRTTQPLLLLTGRHDRLVDRTHSRDFHRIRPDTIELELDSSHAVGEEDPRTWQRLLEWFLAYHRH